MIARALDNGLIAKSDSAMQVLMLLHLAVTAAYLTILWMAQLLVYPQFVRVPADSFSVYHAEHCRRMGWIVAPLFLVEGTTALLLAWQLWTIQPALQTASLGLFLLGHGITFSVFVPLHRQLARTPVTNDDIHRALRLNWLRTVVATARFGVVCAVILS